MIGPSAKKASCRRLLHINFNIKEPGRTRVDLFCILKVTSSNVIDRNEVKRQHILRMDCLSIAKSASLGWLVTGVIAGRCGSLSRKLLATLLACCVSANSRVDDDDDDFDSQLWLSEKQNERIMQGNPPTSSSSHRFCVKTNDPNFLDGVQHHRAGLWSAASQNDSFYSHEMGIRELGYSEASKKGQISPSTWKTTLSLCCLLCRRRDVREGRWRLVFLPWRRATWTCLLVFLLPRLCSFWVVCLFWPPVRQSLSAVAATQMEDRLKKKKKKDKDNDTPRLLSSRQNQKNNPALFFCLSTNVFI